MVHHTALYISIDAVIYLYPEQRLVDRHKIMTESQLNNKV